MDTNQQTKILIVEDDKFLADLLTKRLSESGFTTFYAGDGVAALTTVEEQKPDLVLLDLLLPNTDGYEVLQKLKAKNSSVPVIVLSNLQSQEDINKSKELGAVRFLTKSLSNLDDIVAAIKEVAGKAEGGAEGAAPQQPAEPAP